MRRLVVAAAACAVLVWAAIGSAQDIVPIDTGSIRGSTNGGVTAFKGIPYAAPPVGALRWRPPQPAKAWQGVRDATQFGHDCMQVPSMFSHSPAEDCLYINVWTPEHHGANLPVMVWIYGGAWVVGGSSVPFFDGAELARQGVVLVSFNYRLGRFGFFAFPALDAGKGGDLLGNYGYMDQLAALKWVQRNIAAFGGNPRAVTVFGQSAGGWSVHMLMTSPLAKGLFARAIAQSGGGGRMPNCTGLRRGMDGRPSAEQIGVAFARSQGIDGTGAAALRKLRALPATAIVDGLTAETLVASKSTFSGPVVDGRLVLGNPPVLYERGQYQHVPMMVGANSGDASLSQAANVKELFAPFGADAAAAEAAFGAASNQSFPQLREEVGRDELFVGPARFVAQTLSSQGVSAWEYRFSYVPVGARSKVPAAVHGGETPFVFDHKSWFGVPFTAVDEKMAQVMSAYWVNFAKTGNPNGDGLPAWPRYARSKDVLMNFTEHSGAIAQADPWGRKLDLVEKMGMQRLGCSADQR